MENIWPFRRVACQRRIKKPDELHTAQTPQSQVTENLERLHYASRKPKEINQSKPWPKLVVVRSRVMVPFIEIIITDPSLLTPSKGVLDHDIWALWLPV